MILLDAQLSPGVAAWITQQFGIEAKSARDLGLRDADDPEIFMRTRAMKAIVMTKDQDFVTLLHRHGPPPQIIWITCGNTSNAHLRDILSKQLPAALKLLGQGEPLVEISGE